MDVKTNRISRNEWLKSKQQRWHYQLHIVINNFTIARWRQTPRCVCAARTSRPDTSVVKIPKHGRLSREKAVLARWNPDRKVVPWFCSCRWGWSSPWRPRTSPSLGIRWFRGCFCPCLVRGAWSPGLRSFCWQRNFLPLRVARKHSKLSPGKLQVKWDAN